jgi:hypothetical protein
LVGLPKPFVQRANDLKQGLSNDRRDYTDKKENKIFLIYKEIQKGAVAKSYITNGLLINFAFRHILGSPSSYMTLQLLPSEFPNIKYKINII